LCDLSSTDSLTGLMNRRAFLSVLEQELDRVTRGGEHALLLALDIDHFKRVNDRYGHPAGDHVLRVVTKRLREAVRPMDNVARIGGEEFAVLCPQCPPSFATAIAQRTRVAIESAPIDDQRGRSFRPALGQRQPIRLVGARRPTTLSRQAGRPKLRALGAVCKRRCERRRKRAAVWLVRNR